MSEATEAAPQLGSPRHIAAFVPRHPEGHGPTEQRGIEDDFVQCFFLMEKNWKDAPDLLWQRTVEALHCDMYLNPLTPPSVAPLKSFPHLPPREQNTIEGE